MLRELLAWNQESNPELRDGGLFALAGRLEAEGRFEPAAAIYAELERSGSTLADPARRRLQALAGKGDFGGQAELALRQLVAGVADPIALAAMGAAGLAYRLTRLATLGELLTRSGAGLLTRGLGARLVAGGTAFAVEGLVYPTVQRLAASALRRQPTTDFRSQVLSSYSTLGGLRLAAGAAQATLGLRLPSWHGELLRQGVMLGGILLGSELETALGLRTPTSGTSTLVQAVTTLVHFNVAASLSRTLIGPRLEAWQQEMDFRIRNLETGLPAAPRLAPALAAENYWAIGKDEKDPPRSPPPQSSGTPGGAGKDRQLEFSSTLELSASLLSRHPALITALAFGNIRVKVRGGAWPKGFLDHVVQSLNFHLQRRTLFQTAGMHVFLELRDGPTLRQTATIVKGPDGFFLAGTSAASPTPPSQDPASSPFAQATNLLKAAEAKPPEPEPTWVRFDRELKAELPYVRQGIPSLEAKLILRESYPPQFFKLRHTDIARRLQERTSNLMVPLGFRIVFQLGEGPSPQEISFVKIPGGYERR